MRKPNNWNLCSTIPPSLLLIPFLALFLPLVVMGQNCPGTCPVSDYTETIIDLCDPACAKEPETCNDEPNSLEKCQLLTFDMAGIAANCGVDITGCATPGIEVTVFQGCGQMSTSNISFYDLATCTGGLTGADGLINLDLNPTGLTSYIVCSTSNNLSFGTISVTGCCDLTATAAATDITCNGEDDGSIALMPMNGTAPYTWDIGGGTTGSGLVVSPLAPGTYTVTLTDAAGCTAEATATVNEPAFMDAQCARLMDNLCFGDAGGVAQVTAVGGTPPYDILWQTGETTNIIENLTAGLYSVTVTDANGCSDVCAAQINDPDVMDAQCARLMDNLCAGDAGGVAQVTAVGGTPPYDILWQTGETTNIIENLTAGLYSVTVTDANGCSDVCAAQINDPDVMDAQCARLMDNLCFGDAGGIAQVTAVGGTPPYDILWQTGETTNIIENLTAGLYSVTVTDANGCSDVCAAQINDPDLLEATCTNSMNVTCNGEAGGAAEVSIAGGTAPYSILWNNGATTTTIMNLTAGTYDAVITDANDCTATCEVTITEPDFMDAQCARLMDNLCFGDAGGIAQVTAVGGTPPYDILWQTGETTNIIENLTAGLYFVTVTDANGCSDVCAAQINDPDLLEIACMTTMNASCEMGSDGAAEVIAAGGTPPYSYAWDNGATTASVSGLMAGTYSVIVTDANDCTQTCTANVSEPGELTTMCATTSNVSCNGVSDGTGMVTAMGGTPPYTYAWSNGATTSMISGLAAGSYTVIVTDNQDCQAMCTVTITEPDALVAICNNTGNVSCNGESDGSATAAVSGGTPPYTYDWSNGAITASISGLSAGTYNVVVTDANDCMTDCAVTITEPTILVATCTLIADATCNGQNDGMATASASGGTPPYDISWGGFNPDALFAGTYTVNVTDANGCEASCMVTVGQPSDLSATCSEASPVSCFGGSDGVATVSASGGTAPYDFDWGSEDPNALSYGSYNVTVTDANGCAVLCQVFINQPDEITFDVVTNPAGCNGYEDGSAAIDYVNGGTAPYTYLWSTGETSSSIYDLSSGFYCVTITDANGCSARDCYLVQQIPNLFVQVVSTTECYIGTPCIAATTSGGSFPYNYQWSNGLTTSDQCNLTPGIYSVTVTDINGCTGVASGSPLPAGFTCNIDVTSDFNGSPLSGPGASDASLHVGVTGGAAPFSYLWNNGNTNAYINNLSAGQYCVDITDANGCQETCCYEIEDPIEVVCYELGDYVWLDNNVDGIQSQLESGIPNVIVRLYGQDGYGVFNQIIDYAFTDQDGYYLFDCVYPGQYKLNFKYLGDDYIFTIKDAGTNELMDSDVYADGFTDPFYFNGNSYSKDAGLYPNCDDVDHGGKIGYDETICAGQSADLVEVLPAVGGIGQVEYMWMYATLGTSNWNPIPNSNSPTLNTGPLFTSTVFVRCAKRAGCPTFVQESNSVVITVVQTGPNCGHLNIGISENAQTDESKEAEEELSISDNLDDFTLEQPSQTLEFIAYPNPLVDQVTIKTSQTYEEDAIVQIYTGNYKLLETTRLAAHQSTLSFDFSNYPNGLFIIRIILPNAKMQQSLKVLKIK